MNSIFAEQNTSVASPKVGDILCGSWGYEATLYTFVKVVAVGNKTIKVQEMVTESFDHQTGGMEWKEKLTGETHGEITTKLFKTYDKGYKIKWNSYLNLYGPYTGDGVVSCSNYH
jgi:hypothetical protein